MIRRADDRDAAIIAARDVFWAKGYDDTSVGDLVSATGYNRYTLYSLFGGKLDLFLEVLDHYQKERREVFWALLRDESRPPMEAIEGVFDFCVDQMAERGVGCLLGNIAGDIARAEPRVAERIQTHFAEIVWAFTEALERAAQRAELNPAVTPADGAKLFVVLVLGLGAGVENVQTPQDARASYHAVLQALSTKAAAGAGRRKRTKPPAASQDKASTRQRPHHSAKRTASRK